MFWGEGWEQGEFVYFRIEDARRSVEKEKGRVSRLRISWEGGLRRWSFGKMGVGLERGNERARENLLRSSVFLAFSSLTRLARMEAYSFWFKRYI